MSSHYIYIQCENCKKVESIYTGDVTTDDFDDGDWEGEHIPVNMCIACKDVQASSKDAS